MSGPRALITGDAGFIGRHFRRYLERRGWQVFGCDLVDGEDCRDLFRDPDPWPRIDLFIHAAAIVGGRATIDGEPLKVATDLAIDSDAFQWALKARPGRVLYFSSSAAYPVAQQRGPGVRLHEDHLSAPWVPTPDGWDDPYGVGAPDQSYGWVKVTGEYLAHLARAEGLDVTVVRPFSGYGSDQSLDYPFPTFIQRALACRDGATTFDVWGDGRQVRDWIHVDDVVAGCFAVMESGTTDPVNLCTGRGVSFLDLAGMVLDAAGVPRPGGPAIVPHPDAPTGVRYRVGDPTRMNRYYRHTIDLEDGIARALREATR